jgi:uncharacterized protein (TIGR03382 family)
MVSRVVAAFAGLAVASQAMAFIPWVNANGSASYFSWQNGGSDTGLFGSPTLVGGDTFVFFPSNFRAESINGVAGSAYDRLEFEVIAHAGFSFTDIRVTEFGDYGIVGTGSVTAAGTLFVTNLDTAQIEMNDLVTTPASPITSGFGNWQGNALVDVASQNATRLRIVLNNNLVAITAADGSVAFIEKKVFGSAVGIQIIPSPGSLGLMGLGLMVASRRRR